MISHNSYLKFFLSNIKKFNSKKKLTKTIFYFMVAGSGIEPLTSGL